MSDPRTPPVPSILGSAFATVRNFFTPERNPRRNINQMEPTTPSSFDPNISALGREFASLNLNNSIADSDGSFRTTDSNFEDSFKSAQSVSIERNVNDSNATITMTNSSIDSPKSIKHETFHQNADLGDNSKVKLNLDATILNSNEEESPHDLESQLSESTIVLDFDVTLPTTETKKELQGNVEKLLDITLAEELIPLTPSCVLKSVGNPLNFTIAEDFLPTPLKFDKAGTSPGNSLESTLIKVVPTFSDGNSKVVDVLDKDSKELSNLSIEGSQSCENGNDLEFSVICSSKIEYDDDDSEISVDLAPVSDDDQEYSDAKEGVKYDANDLLETQVEDVEGVKNELSSSSVRPSTLMVTSQDSGESLDLFSLSPIEETSEVDITMEGVMTKMEEQSHVLMDDFDEDVEIKRIEKKSEKQQPEGLSEREGPRSNNIIVSDNSLKDIEDKPFNLKKQEKISVTLDEEKLAFKTNKEEEEHSSEQIENSFEQHPHQEINPIEESSTKLSGKSTPGSDDICQADTLLTTLVEEVSVSNVSPKGDEIKKDIVSEAKSQNCGEEKREVLDDQKYFLMEDKSKREGNENKVDRRNYIEANTKGSIPNMDPEPGSTCNTNKLSSEVLAKVECFLPEEHHNILGGYDLDEEHGNSQDQPDKIKPIEGITLGQKLHNILGGNDLDEEHGNSQDQPDKIKPIEGITLGQKLQEELVQNISPVSDIPQKVDEMPREVLNEKSMTFDEQKLALIEETSQNIEEDNDNRNEFKPMEGIARHHYDREPVRNVDGATGSSLNAHQLPSKLVDKDGNKQSAEVKGILLKEQDQALGGNDFDEGKGNNHDKPEQIKSRKDIGEELFKKELARRLSHVSDISQKVDEFAKEFVDESRSTIYAGEECKSIVEDKYTLVEDKNDEQSYVIESMLVAEESFTDVGLASVSICDSIKMPSEVENKDMNVKSGVQEKSMASEEEKNALGEKDLDGVNNEDQPDKVISMKENGESVQNLSHASDFSQNVDKIAKEMVNESRSTISIEQECKSVVEEKYALAEENNDEQTKVIESMLVEESFTDVGPTYVSICDPFKMPSEVENEDMNEKSGAQEKSMVFDEEKKALGEKDLNGVNNEDQLDRFKSMEKIADVDKIAKEMVNNSRSTISTEEECKSVVEEKYALAEENNDEQTKVIESMLVEESFTDVGPTYVSICDPFKMPSEVENKDMNEKSGAQEKSIVSQEEKKALAEDLNGVNNEDQPNGFKSMEKIADVDNIAKELLNNSRSTISTEEECKSVVEEKYALAEENNDEQTKLIESVLVAEKSFTDVGPAYVSDCDPFKMPIQAEDEDMNENSAAKEKSMVSDKEKNSLGEKDLNGVNNEDQLDRFKSMAKIAESVPNSSHASDFPQNVDKIAKELVNESRNTISIEKEYKSLVEEKYALAENNNDKQTKVIESMLVADKSFTDVGLASVCIGDSMKMPSEVENKDLNEKSVAEEKSMVSEEKDLNGVNNEDQPNRFKSMKEKGESFQNLSHASDFPQNVDKIAKELLNNSRSTISTEEECKSVVEEKYALAEENNDEQTKVIESMLVAEESFTDVGLAYVSDCDPFKMPIEVEDEDMNENSAAQEKSMVSQEEKKALGEKDLNGVNNEDQLDKFKSMEEIKESVQILSHALDISHKVDKFEEELVNESRSPHCADDDQMSIDEQKHSRIEAQSEKLEKKTIDLSSEAKQVEKIANMQFIAERFVLHVDEEFGSACLPSEAENEDIKEQSAVMEKCMVPEEERKGLRENDLNEVNNEDQPNRSKSMEGIAESVQNLSHTTDISLKVDKIAKELVNESTSIISTEEVCKSLLEEKYALTEDNNDEQTKVIESMLVADESFTGVGLASVSIGDSIKMTSEVEDENRNEKAGAQEKIMVSDEEKKALGEQDLNGVNNEDLPDRFKSMEEIAKLVQNLSLTSDITQKIDKIAKELVNESRSTICTGEECKSLVEEFTFLVDNNDEPTEVIESMLVTIKSNNKSGKEKSMVSEEQKKSKESNEDNNQNLPCRFKPVEEIAESVLNLSHVSDIFQKEDKIAEDLVNEPRKPLCADEEHKSIDEWKHSAIVVESEKLEEKKIIDLSNESKQMKNNTKTQFIGEGFVVHVGEASVRACDSTTFQSEVVDEETNEKSAKEKNMLFEEQKKVLVEKDLNGDSNQGQHGSFKSMEVIAESNQNPSHVSDISQKVDKIPNELLNESRSPNCTEEECISVDEQKHSAVEVQSKELEEKTIDLSNEANHVEKNTKTQYIAEGSVLHEVKASVSVCELNKMPSVVNSECNPIISSSKCISLGERNNDLVIENSREQDNEIRPSEENLAEIQPLSSSLPKDKVTLDVDNKSRETFQQSQCSVGNTAEVIENAPATSETMAIVNSSYALSLEELNISDGFKTIFCNRSHNPNAEVKISSTPLDSPSNVALLKPLTKTNSNKSCSSSSVIEFSPITEPHNVRISHTDCMELENTIVISNPSVRPIQETMCDPSVALGDPEEVAIGLLDKTIDLPSANLANEALNRTIVLESQENFKELNSRAMMSDCGHLNASKVSIDMEGEKKLSGVASSSKPDESYKLTTKDDLNVTQIFHSRENNPKAKKSTQYDGSPLKEQKNKNILMTNALKCALALASISTEDSDQDSFVKTLSSTMGSESNLSLRKLSVLEQLSENKQASTTYNSTLSLSPNKNKNMFGKTSRNNCGVLKEINDNVSGNSLDKMGAWISGRAKNFDPAQVENIQEHDGFTSMFKDDDFDLFNSSFHAPTGVLSRESLYLKFDPMLSQQSQTSDSTIFVGAIKDTRDQQSCEKNKNSTYPSPKTFANDSEIKAEIARLKELYLERERQTAEKEKELKRREEEIAKKCLETQAKLLIMGKREEALLKKLKLVESTNNNLQRVVNQYKTLTEELPKQFNANWKDIYKRIEQLNEEKKATQKHIDSAEAAYIDVLTKFMKSKEQIVSYQEAEKLKIKEVEELQKSIEAFEARLKGTEFAIEEERNDIEQRTAQKKTQNDAELARLNAQLRKVKLTLSNIQDSLDKKVEENRKLSGICDDLIAGK